MDDLFAKLQSVEEAGRYEPVTAERWKEANLIESIEVLETSTLD